MLLLVIISEKLAPIRDSTLVTNVETAVENSVYPWSKESTDSFIVRGPKVALAGIADSAQSISNLMASKPAR